MILKKTCVLKVGAASARLMDRECVAIRIAKDKEPTEWPVAGRQMTIAALAATNFGGAGPPGVIAREPQRETPAQSAIGQLQVHQRTADREWNRPGIEHNRIWRTLRDRSQADRFHVKYPGKLPSRKPGDSRSQAQIIFRHGNFLPLVSSISALM